MDFLLFTISWMGFNLLLAAIPVAVGLLILKLRNNATRWILGAMWLVFLPNTIYLLTDVFHFFDDYKKIQILTSMLTIPLYVVLIACGVVTFVFSLYPLDRLLKHRKNPQLRIVVIFFINMLIGIGLTMGRVERINSWELITNMPKTLHAVLAIGTSYELLVTTVLFTLTANLLYFSVENTKLLKTTYNKLVTSFA